MRIKTLIIIVVTGLLLVNVLCSLTYSQTSEIIVKGDTYFKLMRYKDAVAWYKLDSNKAEAQWKIARAYVCYGDNAVPAEKEVNFRAAVIAAKKCITLEETNANGHTWLAAALGNTAMYEGSKTKVRLCNQIKAELTRAVALNPKDDIAYSIFGSFYREIGHISWVEKQLALVFIGRIPDGTYEDSEKAFGKAVALAPNIMRHWYELGLLYKYWGKKSQAIAAFTKAKTCPVLVSSDNKRIVAIAAFLKDLQ
jgi:tetratricopeptide (TPR) repeat protein